MTIRGGNHWMAWSYCVATGEVIVVGLLGLPLDEIERQVKERFAKLPPETLQAMALLGWM